MLDNVGGLAFIRARPGKIRFCLTEHSTSPFFKLINNVQKSTKIGASRPPSQSIEIQYYTKAFAEMQLSNRLVATKQMPRCN